MIKKYPVPALLLTLTLLCLTAVPAFPESSGKITSVTVWGEAVIYDGDKPSATERALQEAFTTAIEQVMGAYVTAASFTQNYIAIDRSVLSKTSGYVKTYEIVERRETPELLGLKVVAVISETSVKDDLTALGILLDAVGNPVMALTGTDEGLDASASIPVIKSVLTGKGFHLTDLNAGGSPDVTVHVNGTITSQNSVGNGLYGSVAAVSARAVRTGTRRVMAAEDAVSNGAGLDAAVALKQAYQQAAEDVAQKLSASVTEKWGQELANGKEIALTVRAGSYETANTFTRYLSRIFGVKKVDMQSFKGGIARYQVRFAGQSRILADLMLKSPPQAIGISIDQLAADLIELTVK